MSKLGNKINDEIRKQLHFEGGMRGGLMHRATRKASECRGNLGRGSCRAKYTSK